MVGLLFTDSTRAKEIMSMRSERTIVLQVVDEHKIDSLLADLISDKEVSRASVNHLLDSLIPEFTPILEHRFEGAVNRLKHSTEKNRKNNLQRLIVEILEDWGSPRLIYPTFSNQESEKVLHDKISEKLETITILSNAMNIDVISPYHTYEELKYLSHNLPISESLIAKCKKTGIEIHLGNTEFEIKTTALSYFDGSIVKSVQKADSLVLSTLKYPQQEADQIHSLIISTPYVYEYVQTFAQASVLHDQTRAFAERFKGYMTESDTVSRVLVVGSPKSILNDIQIDESFIIQLTDEGMSIIADEETAKAVYDDMQSYRTKSDSASITDIENLLQKSEICTLISGKETHYYPTRFTYRNGKIIINPPLIFFDELRPILHNESTSIVLAEGEQTLVVKGTVTLTDEKLNSPQEQFRGKYAFYERRLTVTMDIMEFHLSRGTNEEVFHR